VVTRVLVTGAAGFLGAHLVATGIARGLDVTALTHRSTVATSGARTATADLTSADLTSLLATLRPEIVINAASYGVGADERDSRRMQAINTVAAYRLLLTAKTAGVRRFIQLGTYSEYGDHTGIISESTPLLPKDDYGVTKAAASLLIAAPGAAEPVETIVLRLFNVWGPGERPHRLLQRVIHHCRAGTRLPLTPGDQVKDWTYVGDVACWIVDVALLPAPYPHRIVNVASGERRSVRDMASMAARALKGEHLLDFGAVPVPTREAQTGPADHTRIATLLPSRQITPLGDAIAATIAASRP
jgi:GDP-4-dehydro-6-deoxy-D-mannose reductase